MSVILKYKSIK